MSAITVRNLSPEAHLALEVRAIIAEAVLPERGVGFSGQQRQRWQGELSDDLVVKRDRKPYRPIDLE